MGSRVGNGGLTNTNTILKMPSHSEFDDEKQKEKMLQEWLDQNQYTRKGILRYEAIFGRTYVSVGGETTTKDFVERLDLKPGMKVLDIGCGTGGSAFYMARNYGVDVYGFDLSTNMIGIAQDYRMEMEAAVKHRTQFYIEDAMKMELGKFSNIRRSFIEEFSEYDYNYIEKGWKDKVVRCNQH